MTEILILVPTSSVLGLQMCTTTCLCASGVVGVHMCLCGPGAAGVHHTRLCSSGA